MDSLRLEAERIKLARVLHATADQLLPLEPLGVDGLRHLREAASARMFQDHDALLRRAAAGSKLLPAKLVARLSERVFGALLSARVAGFMPPQRAVAVACELHTPFLADLSVELDPRRARSVLADIPVHVVVAVASELIQRHEYVTMARFVDVLDDDAIDAVVNAYEDDEALLHIGLFVESSQRLSELVRLLPERRLRNILELAVGTDARLQATALWLLTQVEDDVKGRLGDLAVAAGDEVLLRLLQHTRRMGETALLIPVIAHMAPENRRRGMAVPGLDLEALVTDIAASPHTLQAWLTLLPLIAELPVEQQARLAQAVQVLDDAVLAEILDAADRLSAWPVLAGLLPHMDAAARARVGTQVVTAPDALLQSLAGVAAEHVLWPQLLLALSELDDTTLRTGVERLASLGDALWRPLLTCAEDAAVLPALLRLLERLHPTSRVTMATALRQRLSEPQLHQALDAAKTLGLSGAHDALAS